MLLYYNNKEYLDRQYETDDDDYSLDSYEDKEAEEWFRELLESEFNEKKGE